MDFAAINAANRYASLRPVTEPQPETSAAAGFLKGATEDFMSTLQAGEQAAMSAMTAEADPHALVHALSQAELAVETAVTIRDRVVEAYQEILRMPV